jgi:hypothetical protein
MRTLGVLLAKEDRKLKTETEPNKRVVGDQQHSFHIVMTLRTIFYIKILSHLGYSWNELQY